MIKWKVYINSFDESACIYLSHGEKIQIKETDKLLFSVEMNTEEFSNHGTPTIVVGDIPLLMVLQDNTKRDCYNFFSKEPITSHEARYFYNFFGESEVVLYFDNKYAEPTSLTFDILARKENALIANEMLYFLTDNLEDAITICFSRSKRGADLLGDDENNFNKIDAINQTFEFLSNAAHLFMKERKSKIKSDLILSENGSPTGPDSVYWALTNLDKLSPASQDSVNIHFNNRGYYYEQLPKEFSYESYDVYENRVINTFFINAVNFLNSLKNEYSTRYEMPKNPTYTDYVRFDHTMEKFSKMVLDVKIKEIDILIRKFSELRNVYSKIIPSKTKVTAIPKFSSYVIKHFHYKEAFYLIEKCYKTRAPDFSSNKLLLGLKNLSIIYELTVLILLHKEIESVFHISSSTHNFRYHSELNSFGGIDAERPEGAINNHFSFTSSDYAIDLLYEAKIYPFSADSKPGDLIDTSNTNGTILYGKHHFCPDFVLKITSKDKGQSFTIILDAKFKDLNTIKQYDIDELTNKYLMNIHSVGDNGKIKISSIDMLIILFAHAKSGSILRRVAPRHCVTGPYPVFPQSTAIALNTSDVSILNSHLMSIKKLIEV
ncbi:hypothetical protein IFU23_23945 [Pantoea agglomerans]|uniref:DUF2357 domain-containing protein n=1 Tax=Enterobacter agglomerans TaxID=549 RepID=UPI00177C4671|nr:hypothetical protein [Pantoea agglomerans]MBD8155776.1 hypothetical protein [Pantoea agglomerans]MBD8161139.1 hypothetical protein [Pantoea agglomerans]